VKPPSAKEQLAAVREWNARHPVGTLVDVTMDDGTVKRTRTIDEASMLGGHSAVAWLAGFSGCYMLSRVKAVGA
jgi:hypothetical protein